MKKLIIALAACVMLFSCSKEGEVIQSPSTEYDINGHKYVFRKIVPKEDEYGVWIMIPLNDSVTMPDVSSYSYKSGKTTVHGNVIIIK